MGEIGKPIREVEAPEPVYAPIPTPEKPRPVQEPVPA